MKTPYKDVKKYIKPVEGEHFRVEHFDMDEEAVRFEIMRSTFGGYGNETRGLAPGTYIRLVDRKAQQVVMSDTPMELRTNLEFVEAAQGRVMIAGLGLGIILLAVQAKKEVKEIIVYEKYKDIIDIVGKQLPLNKKVKIIEKDIFLVKPEGKFDTLYFDIWNTISSDNWTDMKSLHGIWRKSLKAGGWMKSWRQEDCKRKAAEERAEEREMLRVFKWRRNHIQDSLDTGNSVKRSNTGDYKSKNNVI